MKRANARARDAQGVSVLHHAANGGNHAIIEFILNKTQAADIKYEGTIEKGRTPLAEAVRASQDALVHVQDFEDENFCNPEALARALPSRRYTPYIKNYLTN